MQTLALVACVAKKLLHAAPARELYCSPWFRAARAYVEAQGYPWRILSAEWGLLDPAQVVAPYEQSLDKLTPGGRAWWAGAVMEPLRLWPTTTRMVFLAGRLYRVDLEDWLIARGYTVEVPLAGLGIGQQLRWLKEQTHG